MTDHLTPRQYGAHRKEKNLPGTSHTAVLKAIRTGRLEGAWTKTDRGRFLIDPKKADRAWSSSTDPSQVREPEVAKGGRPPAEQTPDLFGGDELEEPAAAKDGEKGRTHAEAASAERYWKAKEARIRYGKLAGQLVDRGQVEREAYGLAKATREAIENAMVRAAPQVASLTDHAEVLEVLEREVRKALQTLVDRENGADGNAA